MATYGDPHFDGFPSIHRPRVREGWRADDLTRDSLNMPNRSLSDLQDHVRIQKEELRRKDELIRELQGLEVFAGDREPAQHHPLHHFLAPGANGCPTARSDVAAMQARLDTLTCRLRDREAELDTARDTIRGLRAELARQRGGQEDRTVEERRRAEFAARVRHHLGTACPPDDLDGLAAKVAELVKENVDMKAKIHGLTDQQAAMELEAANNKQTIERLLAQVNREFRATFQLQATEAEFKTETEKLTEANEQLTKKVELLEMQLAAEKAALEAAKADLAEKEAQLSKLDCEKREAAHSAASTSKQLTGLVEALANLMSTAYGRVAPTEEAVKEKLRQLLQDTRNHAATVATLEERVKSVAGQLEAQLEANRQREQGGNLAQLENKDLREKLKAAEAELAAGDVVRDGLKADKDRLYKYLQRLGRALNMESSAIDVAFDALGEGLLDRAQQLSRQAAGGGGCGAGGCSGGGIGGFCDAPELRRRVQSLKEQLESKELHMELLRRRMGGQQPLPDCGGGGGGAADIGDRERARRAELRLEKAHRMLDDARREVDDLRAQLSAAGELRAAATAQDRDLQHMETALDKLERVRQKQAQRIAELKSQLAECRREADDSVRCLADELRAARRELEEAARRDRQLTELRAAVSRLAGSGFDGVANDADIVARLERLLLWQRREQQHLPPMCPPQMQQQQQQQQQCSHGASGCVGGACDCRHGGCGGGGGGGACDCRSRSRCRCRRHSGGGGGGSRHGVRSASYSGAECRRY